MLKTNLVLASMIAGAISLTGCSQQNDEAATNDAVVENAIDDTLTATEGTVNNIGDGVKSVGESAMDGAQEAETAIADGTSAAVEGTANLANDGATAVADGANDMVDGTQEAMQSGNDTATAIAEDQQY